MTAPLRVGLVGGGFIGAVHARSIHAAGARLVGVAASNHGRSAAAARRLGAERAFSSGLELATDEGIDVVHIATPNHLHHSLSMAALEAGKHVVCEKPLALSAAEADQMAATATTHQVIGAVPFVNRFYAMAREAREQVRRGQYGAVTTIHGSYLQDWLLDPGSTDWRVDPAEGGPSRAFADIGSHWCDLAEWITGQTITELAASTATTVATRPTSPGAAGAQVLTEDVAGVLFHTSGGATGLVTISQVAAGRKNRLWIEIDASERSVVFDQEEPERLLVGAPRGSAILARDPSTLSPAAAPYAVLPPGHVQGFHDCFDAFVRDVYLSITRGRAVEGLPTFTDGARSARLVEAVLASADKHAWIEV